MKTRIPKDLENRIEKLINEYHDLFKGDKAKIFLGEFQNEYYDYTMRAALEDFHKDYSEMHKEVIETIYQVERYFKCIDEFNCRVKLEKVKFSPLTLKVMKARKNIEDFIGINADEDSNE